MRDRHRISLLSIPLALAVISCGGGGSDGPTTPATPTASAIAAVSGGSQTGKAEGALSAPLVVKVTSSSGAAISGVTVSFATASGSLNPSSATTDASGNAQTIWTLGSVIGAQSATASAAGLTGSPVSFSATAASAWTTDATIFTHTEFGANGPLADVAVLKLNDGRFRMIIGASPGSSGGMRSATSTDGVKFTLESGFRVAVCAPAQQIPCFYHPFVMRLDDGRVKLFVGLPRDNQGTLSGIYSFTSNDEGMTFTLDAGVRVTAAAAGTEGVSGPSIARMKNGGWRMYFSNAILTTTGPGPTKIVSAFSTDLTNWTVDAGVRIGEGSPVLTGRGEHPGSIANADGSITLVYFRNNGAPTALFYSTSSDGLSFTREARTGIQFQSTLGPGNDPFLMLLSNGNVRMYYNWGDDVGGAIYTASRAPFTVNAP